MSPFQHVKTYKIFLISLGLLLLGLRLFRFFYSPNTVEQYDDKLAKSVLTLAPSNPRFSTTANGMTHITSVVSSKEWVDFACEVAKKHQEQLCLSSNNLDDCSEDLLTPLSIEHIVLYAPQLCEQKKLYYCELLLRLVPQNDPKRFNYEQMTQLAKIQEAKSASDRCSGESDTIHAEISGPGVCFYSSKLMEQVGELVLAHDDYERGLQLLKQQCDAQDPHECWTSIFNQPQRYYSLEDNFPDSYNLLTEEQKASESYLKFTQLAKARCKMHPEECFIFENKFPPDTADRDWVRAQWTEKVWPKCENEGSVEDCWFFYTIAKYDVLNETADVVYQKIYEVAKKRIADNGLTACMNKDFDRCQDFLFRINGEDGFIEEFWKAKKLIIENGLTDCKTNRNIDACRVACLNGH